MNLSLLLRFAAAGLVMFALSDRAQAQGMSSEQRAADFTAFCDFVREQYAYFDVKKTDWDATCRSYAPRAAAAADRDAFIGVLERAMGELYDHHAHLGTNTNQSPRLVPTQSQVFGAWRDGKAMIVDVRHDSPAKAAGVRAGMQVLAINGKPIEKAGAALSKSVTAASCARIASAPSARDWKPSLTLGSAARARSVSFSPRLRRSNSLTPR